MKIKFKLLLFDGYFKAETSAVGLDQDNFNFRVFARTFMTKMGI